MPGKIPVKKLNNLKKWQQILIGLFAAILVSAAVELICNAWYFGLSDDEQGLITIDSENVTYTGYTLTADGLVYDGTSGSITIQLGGMYVHKFVYSYDYDGLFNVNVTIHYTNAMGAEASVTTEDKNSSVLTDAYIVVDKYVDYIVLSTSDTLLYEDGLDYIDFTEFVLTVTGFSVKNAASVNWLRVMAVFIACIAGLCLYVFRDFFGGRIEYAFFVVALSAGMLILACLPATKVGYDEETHFANAFRLSVFPGGIEVSEEYQWLFVSGKDTWALSLPDTAEERAQVDEFFDEACYIVDDITEETSAYLVIGTFDEPYIIQAAFLKLGRALGMSFVQLYMFGRFGNLLTYLFLMFLAIRIIPAGKRLLVLIGLMPSPLYYACTYTYDTWVMAFGMLGIALLLREIMEEDRMFSWGSFGAAMLCFVVGFWPKPVYVPLVLTALLIPAAKFEDKKQKRAERIFTILVFVIVLAIFIIPRLTTPTAYGDTRGGDIDFALQLKNVITHPLAFMVILIKNIWDSLPNYLVGRSVFLNFGHWGVVELTSVTMIYTLITVIGETPADDEYAIEKNGDRVSNDLFISDTGKKIRRLSRIQRFWLMLFSLGAVAIIWGYFYLSYTEVGKSTIAGVQARYFLPVLLPLYMVVRLERVKINIPSRTKNMMVIAVSGILLFALVWNTLLVGGNW